MLNLTFVFFGCSTGKKSSNLMLVDYLFHIWVIVSLFIGVSAGYKLKKLPSEEEEQPEWEQPVSCTNTFED